ncbi:MAG: hypothetical protein DCC58_13555, partial [Chloroflexi bacterium]
MDDLITRAVAAIRLLDVQIAPDGSDVAFVTTEAPQAGETEQSEIWLVPAGGGTARRMTASGANDGNPRWSPDGRWIAFSSDRRGSGAQQLYLLPRAGGEALRITDHPGGIGSFAWSPDGRMLAFLARDEEPEDVQQRRKDRDDAHVADEQPRLTGVWVIELPADPAATETLPAARKVSPDGYHVGGYVDAGFAWAPDSDGFAIMAGDSPSTNARIRSEMYLLDLNGNLTSLGQFEGITSSPRFSPDGSTLAFIGADGAIPARWVLQTLPVTGGTPHVVAPGFAGAFHSFHWLPDGDHLLVGVETGQQHRFLLADLERGELRPAATPGDRPGSGAEAFSCSADGRRWAFAWADATSFGDVYVAEQSGATRRLTDLNPWTREYTWGEQREITWTAFDGLEIEGLLILPVGYEEGTRYPLLTHIHGGPAAAWVHTLYADWHNHGQFLAQRGYAVFMPNPRGSTGRGIDFLKAITHSYGEPDWQDINTGIDALVARGIADPERLVVGGWSGGGYLTNWAITHSTRFKAAIAGAGPSNWISFLGTADIRAVFSRYVGAIEEDPETAWRLSPIRLVNAVSTPTLFLHGEQD